MPVSTTSFKVRTNGNSDMLDITGEVQEKISKGNIKEGIATVFIPGSTASVSTVEYEPGLKKDIPEAMEKIAPKNKDYEHHKTWGCDNGSSHVRATLMGPGKVFPFKDKALILGQWQQIVLLDFDTKTREREVIVQIIGE